MKGLKKRLSLIASSMPKMLQKRDGGSRIESPSASTDAGKLSKGFLKCPNHPISEHRHTLDLAAAASLDDWRLHLRRTTTGASYPSHRQTHHTALSLLRPYPTMREAKHCPLRSPIHGLHFGQRHLLYSIPTLMFCRLGTRLTTIATALFLAQHHWTFSLFRIHNHRRQPCRTTLPSAS